MISFNKDDPKWLTVDDKLVNLSHVVYFEKIRTREIFVRLIDDYEFEMYFSTEQERDFQFDSFRTYLG